MPSSSIQLALPLDWIAHEYVFTSRLFGVDGLGSVGGLLWASHVQALDYEVIVTSLLSSRVLRDAGFVRGMSCCCTGSQVCRKRFGGSTGIARPVRFRGMSITAFQRYAKRSTLCALHYPCSSGRTTSREFMHYIALGSRRYPGISAVDVLE